MTKILFTHSKNCPKLQLGSVSILDLYNKDNIDIDMLASNKTFSKLTLVAMVNNLGFLAC